MSTPALLALFSAFVQGFSFAFARQLTTYSQNRIKLAFYSLFAFAFPGLLLAPSLDFDMLFAHPLLPILDGVVITIGQVSLMEAMKRAQASFVVPMMGLKIFWVAALSALFLGQVYSPLIYVAAAGVFASLFFLTDGTLKGSLPGLFFVSITTLGFGGNDIIILMMLERGFHPLDAFIYSLGMPLLFLGPLSFLLFRNDWKPSRPFVRALGLYGVLQAISIISLVVAMNIAREATVINIIQGARGLFSILAVYVFARLELSGFERITAQQYRKRVIGAAIMMISLTLAILAS